MSGTQQDGTGREEQEADRDDVLEDTFPASDPPAVGGSTGPEDTKPA